MEPTEPKPNNETGHVIPENDVERKISLELTGLEWWKVVEMLNSKLGSYQLELSKMSHFPEGHPARSSYESSIKMLEEILKKLQDQIGY